MAKKSARSKGYRKNTVKKPYLSKKEIILLILIVVVVVLGIVLFNIFYDDGSLDIVDGVAQTEGTNSLIVNTGTGRAPHYYKLGQVAELDGYTLSAEVTGSDENVQHYTLTPNEDSSIEKVVFEATSYNASQLASTMLAAYSSTTGGVCSEMGEAEIDGHKVEYFTYYAIPTEEEETEEVTEEPAADATEEPTADATVEPSDTETTSDETEEDTFTPVQTLNAFITAGERCIVVQVSAAVETQDDYLDDAVLADALNQALTALSFETK